MSESITQRLNGTQLDSKTRRELRALFVAMLDRIEALETKLNADGGVTDTDYGAVASTAVVD